MRCWLVPYLCHVLRNHPGCSLLFCFSAITLNGMYAVFWAKCSLGQRLMATVASRLRSGASTSGPSFGAGITAGFVGSVFRSWFGSAAMSKRRWLCCDGSLIRLVPMFAWFAWWWSTCARGGICELSAQWVTAKTARKPVFWLAPVQTLPVTDCLKCFSHSGPLFQDGVYRESAHSGWESRVVGFPTSTEESHHN